MHAGLQQLPPPERPAIAFTIALPTRRRGGAQVPPSGAMTKFRPPRFRNVMGNMLA